MKALIILIGLLILPSVLAQQPNPIVMGRNTNDTLQRTLWNFRLNSSNLVDGVNSNTTIPFIMTAGGTGATNFTTKGVVYAEGSVLSNAADFIYTKSTKQVTADNLLVNGAFAGNYNIARFGSNTSTMLMFTESSKEFSFTAGSNGTAYPNAVFATTNTRLPFLTITGDCWGDSQAPALSFKTDATAPSFLAFGPSGNLLCYTFAAAGTDDQVYFTVQLDHDYAEGTDIYWHVHWAETATTGAGTNVIWGLETSWANVTGTYGAPTTNYVTNAVSGTNWKHSLSSFPAASGLNKTVSSIIVCRLFRLASSAADDYDQPAAVMSVDAHYRKDTIGSRNESSK